MNDELWVLYPHIWPTKSSFFVWLRGSLRRAVWNTYPPKLEVLKANSSAPPDGYVGRTKKFARCALTGEIVPKRNCQVDHITGNVSLQNWDDVLPFIRHLCATKDNLQVISKEAHDIKSYSERNNIPFEEAAIIKKAIKLINNKKDKDWLIERGIKPDKNTKGRRQQIIDELKRNK